MTDTIAPPQSQGAANQSGAHINKDAYKEAKDFLPLNGVETGTTNFQSFTEATFAFRISPGLLLDATLFALVLGLIGGAAPAWKAARLLPTQALRRQ